jgi:hypothetical protein
MPMIWGRIKMGNQKEHPAKPWQKIVRPAENELPNGSEPPAWISRYLELADVMIRRVQRRMERTQLRKGPRHRDAA